jgi:hypothetical protein
MSATVLAGLGIALFGFEMEVKRAVTVSFLILAGAQLGHVFNMVSPRSGFARQLAAKLQHARTENLYERLVLVAPPTFLGLLRSSLDAPTAQLIVGSLDMTV